MPLIKYNDQLGDILEENYVYFTYNKRKRFKEDDILWYPPNLRIEKHCIYVVGNTLNTMGMCSFTRSRLTERTTVGRYSSVAPNLKVMGFQHPIDRFSTSPITYSTHPSTVNVPLAAGTEEGNFQAFP